MEKLTKTFLLPKAKELYVQGYKNLHATHDGQFFTEADMADSHAKNIGSEVFKFSCEDLALVCECAPVLAKEPETVSEPHPVEDHKPVKFSKPIQKKKVTQTKKK